MSPASERPALRIAVLVSGSGRTLQNLVELIACGELPVEIAVVVASLSRIKGVERARAAGLPVVTIRRPDHPDEEAFSRRIVEALEQHGAQLACLAGWACFWRIPDHWMGRVMNIHPALLPKFGGQGFYGHRVHEAVLAAGDPESGCTVHFANNTYDAGPIILQRRVPVLPDDTPESLAARVFEQERVAYPEAIRLFAEGRLTLRGDRVERLG
jgi:formyltetrahydrofolate-dependent phosphoribosylglycinamide formyltransferase